MKTAAVSFHQDIAEAGPKVIVPVFEDQQQGPEASLAINSTEFTGKAGQLQVITHPFDKSQVYLLGLGKQADFNELTAGKAAGAVFKSLRNDKPNSVQIDASQLPAASRDSVAARLADSLVTASYAFTAYKTMPSPESDKPKIDKIEVRVDDTAAAQAAYAPLEAVTKGQFLAADVTNEAGNKLNPITYGDIIKTELEPLGVNVWILEKSDIEALQMAGVLAVNKGSSIPPRVVIMQYDGTNGQDAEALGLVGKGVTFDTGAISIKPGANMADMKMDMGGSAMMVGSVYAAAAAKMPVNLLCAVGLVKNMPDGDSTTPGDIIETASGKTFTDDNTDAEGRMVLCELLHLMQHQEKLKALPQFANFQPVKLKALVDAATLTGAQITALGQKRAAVFSNDESLPEFVLDAGPTLADRFNRAGRVVGEQAWPMPLGEEYAAAMRKSPIGDLSNIASGNGAGSSTAAEFLHFFIEKDANGKDKLPWAHIDMAGPGIPDDKISRGWGVRLMVEMFKRHFSVGSPTPYQPPGPNLPPRPIC